MLVKGSPGQHHGCWCLDSSFLQVLTRLAVNITVNKIDIKRVRYHYSRDRVTIVSLLWRHQQSIVTSLAEERQREWDTGMMCKDRRFYRHLWIRYVECYFCVYLNTKLTLSWALKQFVTRVHTLFAIHQQPAYGIVMRRSLASMTKDFDICVEII